MTAVADSGPLIVLAKINHLHLLPALYGNVLVPQAVYDEAVVIGRVRGYHDAETEDIWIHPDLCRRVRRQVLGK